MNIGAKPLQQKPDLSLFFWIFFALLTMNALAFIFSVAAPHIRNDIFRHLQDIVLPLLQGDESLSVLWTNHHPAPLLHIIQIINLKYLGFRLDYDAYLGFSFQVLTTLLILWAIVATTRSARRATGYVGVLGAVVISAIALGFNSLDQFAWPLLALQQYLHFFGLVVFILIHRAVVEPGRWRLAAVALSSLVIIFANASFGTVFLTAILAVLVLLTIIERQAAYAWPALVVIGALVVQRLFMLVMVPEGPDGPVVDVIGTVKILLMHPLRTVTQFSIGLGSGLVDVVSLKNRFPGAEQPLVHLSQLLTGLFTLVFIVYLKKRLYRVSVVPLALMMVAVLFGASSLIFRFWFLDDWGLATPRYVPNFKLGIIGMLWALWILLNDDESVREKFFSSRLLVAVATLCLGAILLLQGLQIYAGWHKAPAMREANHNHALGVFLAGTVPENRIGLPFIIRGFPQDKPHLADVLAYLRKNELNVFSARFRASALLDEHRASRRLFNAAAAAVTVSRGENDTEQVVRRNGALEASWEIVPDKIVVSNTSAESHYLRVKLQSKSYNPRGLVITGSGEEQVRNIDIYRGRSNLFFTLPAGAKLEFNTPPDAAVEEIEIRG